MGEPFQTRFNNRHSNIPNMPIVSAFKCNNCVKGIVLVDQHGNANCANCHTFSGDLDRSSSTNQCALKGCDREPLNFAVPACEKHLCTYCRMGVATDISKDALCATCLFRHPQEM